MEARSSPLIFLLSPAHCGGIRAGYVMREGATFSLARKIRSSRGASIGEVFAFLSGLYFRGKLAYAARFARPPAGISGSLVITTNRGLIPAHKKITIDDLRSMGVAKIDCDDPIYRGPLLRDIERLAKKHPAARFVLLGSVATGKYVNVLLDVLGARLMFPSEFVGRGDMSRGGLMLRCVDEDRELTYVPVRGAVRNGARPPKLERRVNVVVAARAKARPRAAAAKRD